MQLSEQWIAVAGISAENTTINGRNITYGFPAAGGFTTTLANLDRSFLNVAPELALVYRPNTDWQFRGRVATGYATPSASNLTVTSAGVPGNNGSCRHRRTSASTSEPTGRRCPASDSASRASTSSSATSSSRNRPVLAS